MGSCERLTRRLRLTAPRTHNPPGTKFESYIINMSYRVGNFRVKPQAIANLEKALDDEAATRIAIVADIRQALQDERDTRLYDDTKLRDDMQSAMADEVTAREAVASAIADEAAARVAGLAAEATAREAVNTALLQEVEDREAFVGNAIRDERTDREQSFANIQQGLYEEVQARATRDEVVDERLNTAEAGLATEIAAREADVYALNQALGGEAAARQALEEAVNSDKASAAALADEVAARLALADSVSTAAGTVSALDQAMGILVGPEGALEVSAVPGGSDKFEYSGALQDLSAAQ